ncbi:hypothetical protein [Sinobacterium caligoides]|uniref:hypothetical protein n=1 Tax=Sinobacterium caligoides TaxID=933926 RepID=UPI001B85CA94|nr:hypothetical protein [Sinobacterium caligoides]
MGIVEAFKHATWIEVSLRDDRSTRKNCSLCELFNGFGKFSMRSALSDVLAEWDHCFAG